MKARDAIAFAAILVVSELAIAVVLAGRRRTADSESLAFATG